MSVWRDATSGLIIRDGTSGDIERCASCPCGNSNCLNNCTSGAPSQLQLTLSGFSDATYASTCGVDPLTYFLDVLNGSWVLDFDGEGGGECSWSDTYTAEAGSGNGNTTTIRVTMTSLNHLRIEAHYLLTTNPSAGSTTSCDDDGRRVSDMITDWAWPSTQDCFNISESGTLSDTDGRGTYSGSYSLVSL